MAKKTRAKAAKTIKKEAPAAVAKKTPAAQAKESAVVAVKPRATTFDRLQRWHTWLSGIYLFQAIAVMLLAKDRVFPIQISFPTVDPIASDIANHQVSAMASRHLLDAHLSYLIAFFLIVPVAVHIMMATFYRREYESGLKKHLNLLRWISFGLTTALMVVSIALVTGITSISLLVALAVLPIIGATAGFISELLPMQDGSPAAKALKVIGYGAVLGMLAVAALQVWAGMVYGHLAGYVYGIYVSMIILAIAGVVHHYRQMQATGRWKTYTWVEQGYIILEFIIVTALAWQLFVGALL